MNLKNTVIGSLVKDGRIVSVSISSAGGKWIEVRDLNITLKHGDQVSVMYRPNKGIDFITTDIEITSEPYRRDCECGGEKAQTTHSNWCPKHE